MSHLKAVTSSPKADYSTQGSQEYVPKLWLCLEQLIIQICKTKYRIKKYLSPQLADSEGNDSNDVVPIMTVAEPESETFSWVSLSQSRYFKVSPQTFILRTHPSAVLCWASYNGMAGGGEQQPSASIQPLLFRRVNK